MIQDGECFGFYFNQTLDGVTCKGTKKNAVSFGFVFCVPTKNQRRKLPDIPSPPNTATLLFVSAVENYLPYPNLYIKYWTSNLFISYP